MSTVPLRIAGVLSLYCAAAHGVDSADSAVRIDYAAPASCPDRAEFERRVKERIQRARFAEAGEIARTFRVTVTSKPERSVARVEFVDADGETVSRTLGADACDEVVNAIALVTALAMDARAGGEPTSSARTPRTVPPPSSSPATPPREPAPPAPPRERSRLRADAGLGLEIASGTAPSVSIGLGLFVELRPSFFSVRASAHHTDSGKLAVEGGRARFRYWGGRLELCSLRWQAAEHLLLVPCLGVDAGALHGEGLPGPGIVEQRSATELWLAPLALGRAQLDLDDFLLLEASVDVRAPLQRHEFFLENPDRSVHDVPAVAFGASLGLGFRFH